MSDIAGRERERAVLLEVLEPDGPLVVFVHGPGGIGKSVHWDDAIHGTSGIYAGQAGNAHMRGHNMTHLDPLTGLFLVDEFHNTYVVSGLR